MNTADKIFTIKLPNGHIVRTNWKGFQAGGIHTSKSAWRAQQRLFARKAKSHATHDAFNHRLVIAAIKKGVAKISDLCKNLFSLKTGMVVNTYEKYTNFYTSVELR
jgi:hypothetical protein